MSDVLLINMPFSNLRLPSIALGLLKSALTRANISCDVAYFNLRFGELIGSESFTAIEYQTYPEHLVGEWIFSRSLFQDIEQISIENYVARILRTNRVDLPGEPMYPPQVLDQITMAIYKAREKVDDFLAECLQNVLAAAPKIVGFTSVFEQHLASLSLARLIKLQAPECFIVFGGSNCEGSMGQETLRQFEFIDAVVSGEGDRVFPQLVESVLNHSPRSPVPGVFDRQVRALEVANQPAQNTAPIEDLDELPVPDYDDYFEQLAAGSLKLKENPILLFETSRGCWWGEKQHCTFCGLNGATMRFRSKSGQRALEEITYLSNRYPGCSFNAVDNIIDMKYFKTFISALASQKHDFGLFYEVKANLKKNQLQLLREAGVKKIQPGIESFSDNVLRIMRKGVTALQNVQLLKWCTELDINACYNIIWGFPGESSEDYERMTDLIAIFPHLRPPAGAGVIRIDRFSPNFNDSMKLGFGALKQFPAYELVYPFEPPVLFNLAYFFEPSEDYENPDQNAARQLSTRIKHWKEFYPRSDLFFMDKETRLLIWDFRPEAKEPLVAVTDSTRFIYLACDEVKTPRQVLKEWRDVSSEPLEESEVRSALDSFVAQSLMINQGDQYLSLAYRKSL